MIGRDRNQNLHWYLFFVLCGTAALFLNSLSNGFVQDDWFLMVGNDAYKNLDLSRIFLSMANGLEYLPVRDITLLADFFLWGTNPLGFHLTNLFLFLAELMAVFFAARTVVSVVNARDAELIALWTMVIFALHPLQTEVVNYIAARNTLLAGLFLSLSLPFCVKGISEKKNALFIISCMFFSLALFSKANAVFFPLFLALFFVLMPKGGVTFSRKLSTLALFVAIDLAAVWVHLSIADATGMVNEGFVRYGINSSLFMLAKAFQIPFFYLRMAIFPYPMTILHNVAFLSPPSLLLGGFAGVALVIVGVLAWSWRNRFTVPVLAFGWFFFALVPVMNFFPSEPIVADRYAHLALFGFALGAAWLMLTFQGKRVLRYAVYGILVLWAGLIFLRNQDWHDDLSLWKSALVSDPEMPRVMLANPLWERGRYLDALALLKEEHERRGGFHYDEFLGKYALLSGRYDVAIFHLQKALARSGDASKELYLELAAAYERMGQLMPALDQYLKAQEIKDAGPLGRMDMAAKEGVKRMRSQFMPKLTDLQLAAANEPTNSEIHAALALYYQTLGMYNDAEVSYRKTVDLDPSRWETWYNLGLTDMKLRKYGDAVKAFERSLTIRPGNAEALNNIGISYMAQRQYQKAAYYYRKALENDPGYFYGAFNLGRVYFVTADGKQAREYFAMAKRLAKGNADLEATVGQYLSQIK